tara:strand:+ start:88 stop:1368 length:1281 start_codon:yes stop_codon:yes gene_type:complete
MKNISVNNSEKIAVIQFPGSNTERETLMACQRVGLNAVELLWNDLAEKLSEFHGYVIIGGFSYEDRSRAGVIAALAPIIKEIKVESEKGKPVLGICNGAQILVESGLIPGTDDLDLSMALTDNKRIKDGHIIGVGYYNTWSNLIMSVPPNRCAFTRHLNTGDFIRIPLAHGEGRFVVTDKLLRKLISNNQTVYRYCNAEGIILDEFPTNPNGSIYNLAAVCNPKGNVMAMMPHPERTDRGDVVFSSMKEFIKNGNPTTMHSLSYNQPHYEVSDYSCNMNKTEWIVDMIINDNEASSVEVALNRLGFDVIVKRQTHWEIGVKDFNKSLFNKIEKSGELFNSNKEFLSEIPLQNDYASFLIRPKDDIKGQSKLESLTNRFEIKTIKSIKFGVIWNLKIKSGNLESILGDILETNIFFNPLSHECYRIH